MSQADLVQELSVTGLPRAEGQKLSTRAMENPASSLAVGIVAFLRFRCCLGVFCLVGSDWLVDFWFKKKKWEKKKSQTIYSPEE